MRTLRLVSLAVVALALAVPRQALEAQGETLAFRYVLTVTSGSEAAFEAAWKEHIAFREANGDTWVWNVFQQQFGDAMGSYVIRSDGHSWADLDSYFAGNFNELTQAHLGATVRPLIESATSSVVALDADASNPADDGASMNVFVVTNFILEASGVQAFDAGLAAFKEAVVATSYPLRYTVSRHTVGGPGNNVMVVGQSPNFAGLEQPDTDFFAMLVGHFGAERTAEIFEPFFDAIESSNSNLVIRRADLSSPAN